MSCVPKSILEAADVSAVTQLILRERFSRDLGLWEQMRDCFHEDSVVRISWINASGPEFVRRSKEMAERNVNASHRLGPIFVTLAGDRAIAQLLAIIDIPFKLEGIEVMLSSHTRLLLRRRTTRGRVASFRFRSGVSARRDRPRDLWPDGRDRSDCTRRLSSELSLFVLLFCIRWISGAQRSRR